MLKKSGKREISDFRSKQKDAFELGQKNNEKDCEFWLDEDRFLLERCQKEKYLQVNARHERMKLLCRILFDLEEDLKFADEK